MTGVVANGHLRPPSKAVSGRITRWHLEASQPGPDWFRRCGFGIAVSVESIAKRADSNQSSEEWTIIRDFLRSLSGEYIGVPN